MDVLGRSRLIDRLRDHSLVVSPILSFRQINSASIDLRMGNVALIVRARGSSHVDPADWKEQAKAADLHAAEFYRQQKHERYEIPFGTRILLHPGSLTLVPAFEWLKLPSDLLGSVTARSTWAREGLSIATATTKYSSTTSAQSRARRRLTPFVKLVLQSGHRTSSPAAKPQ